MFDHGVRVACPLCEEVIIHITNLDIRYAETAALAMARHEAVIRAAVSEHQAVHTAQVVLAEK